MHLRVHSREHVLSFTFYLILFLRFGYNTAVSYRLHLPLQMGHEVPEGLAVGRRQLSQCFMKGLQLLVRVHDFYNSKEICASGKRMGMLMEHSSMFL